MNSHRRQSTNKRKHQNEINPTKRTKVETEKRLRRFRTSMSIAIYDRIERALTQRLYLLAMTKSSNEHLQREYKVLGQTANVYTVIISHLPSCTCPDYAKGYLCKHIIFVLHRVLKVPRNSSLLYQQALVTNELNEIFSKADEQNNDVSIYAEDSIRQAYRVKTGDPNVILPTKIIEQKSITDDDECPICYEKLLDEQNNILFCSTSCGNNLHKNCFEKWRRAKASLNESITCPFCRVQWKNVDDIRTNTAYLNLAAYSTTNDYDDDLEDLFFDYYY